MWGILFDFLDEVCVTACISGFFSQSESGGAFKGFKGFIIPSAKGGGGFTGFGNGTGLKPLEGLSNGSSGISNTPPFISLKTTSETQSVFGKLTYKFNCAEF